MKNLTKKAATRYFKTVLLNPSDTWTDKRLAWNGFIESLRRDGKITEHQAATWGQPDCVKPPSERRKRKKPFKAKTIDITSKEWFDKVNGNSYFSAVITLNFGMEDAKMIFLPFQYGYGEHYLQMAQKELAELGHTKPEKYEWGGLEPLWSYCREKKIVLRCNKIENCLKRDVINWGKE